MNCYRCKKKDLKSAVRVMMPAKNAREKDNFRDICDDCYPVIMQEKGYTLINGIWYSKYSRPTKRAPDAGESAPSKPLSTLEVDPDLENDATPAPAQVA